MARLIYSGIQSLDGYIADAEGGFDWAAPTEEVHAFVNDLMRPLGTYLYGRRMYEVMRYWETADSIPDQTAVTQDFTAMWRAADKVVFSSTLDAVSTTRTTLERTLDATRIRQLKDDADHDLGIGGAGIAATAVRDGLVDVYQLFITPVVVGGGTAFLPDDVRLDLELVTEHRFGNGVLFLEYHAAS